MMLLESGCSDCLRRQSRTRHDRANRACFSCNEISVAATSRLPLETWIAFSGAMEGKSALTFFHFCLLLAADSPGGGNFFAGAVLADFTPRPSNLHFPFFRVSFSCFSPLWRCDAFRLSSPRNCSGQSLRRRNNPSPVLRQSTPHEAVCWRHLHRSPLRFPSRIVPRLLPLLHSVQSVIAPSGNFTQ